MLPLDTVMVPVRELVEVFAVKEKLTVPFPLPLVALSVIHETFLETVHEELH